MSKLPVLLLTAFAISTSGAGELDPAATMGGANVFTVRDFISQSSDVEGAIVSGGNVSVRRYSVNEHNRAAYVGYAIAAGGNITVNNGSIHNGKTYAGGKTVFDQGPAAPDSTSRPVEFNAVSREFYTLARDLSNVAATGTVDQVHDGLVVQGSGRGGVDVFHLSSEQLRDAAAWQLEGLAPGQTLIFNISGERGTFRNGEIDFAPLAGYNVLFNFYEAREVDVRGVIGTVLAPYAAMRARRGVVKGNVIVDTWDSNVQIDAAHYFRPVALAGFRDAPAAAMLHAVAARSSVPPKGAAFSDIGTGDISVSDRALADISFANTPSPKAAVDVPEPSTLALLATGLLCAVALRRLPR